MHLKTYSAVWCQVSFLTFESLTIVYSYFQNLFIKSLDMILLVLNLLGENFDVKCTKKCIMCLYFPKHCEFIEYFSKILEQSKFDVWIKEI